MVETGNARLLSAIGLARKAGKLTIGTDMVCDAVRSHKITLVIASGYASENTKKRISDCASFYKTDVNFVQISTEELGAAIGKSACACIGVSDENFRILIERNL